MKQLIAVAAGVLAVATAFGADGPCVIPQRGYFRIRVGTAGLFGTFAHNHSIEAQKITGCASIDPADITHSSIKLTFGTADIRVIDPKENEKDRAEVQKTMETEVLRVSEFPQIAFESTGIESAGGNQLRVHGNLTIRGKMQSVVIPLTFARVNDGTYQANGKYTFKQSSFAIKPIQLGGGTVRVKDELETEFEIFLK
jgi:polyisoprenoid-binding protein YceI